VIVIKEDMQWPPFGTLDALKLEEYATWYAGEADILTDFYSRYSVGLRTAGKETYRTSFWGRQLINKNQIAIHVPVASDIAATSSDLLFSESPIIKLSSAHTQRSSSSDKDEQDLLDTMLYENGFFRKILEGAETASAMGGCFIKMAWDSALSPYPLLVVEQTDCAIPEFSFGILTKVTFWREYLDEKKVLRLLETYSNDGTITYELYVGSQDKLGKKDSIEKYEMFKKYKDVDSGFATILCAYVPNMLPNRLNRTSYLGRSDYSSGVIDMMDSLDETYSAWIKEIGVAKGRLHVPEDFLDKKKDETGRVIDRFNIDKDVYVLLDVDPTQIEGSKITATQFDIRATQFEITTLNLLERIITSAGYSPQTFGLNIQGRAESGTALAIRERKSICTKSKKETYWEPAIRKLVMLCMLIGSKFLSLGFSIDSQISCSFGDSLTNDINEISTSVQKIASAMAASVETKVRMLHTEWSEDEVATEVSKIIAENGLMAAIPPDSQMNLEE